MENFARLWYQLSQVLNDEYPNMIRLRDGDITRVPDLTRSTCFNYKAWVKLTVNELNDDGVCKMFLVTYNWNIDRWELDSQKECIDL